MRNAVPSVYNYTKLKIVNPEKAEVQAIQNSNIETGGLSVEVDTSANGDSFVISTDKSQYSPREKVQLSIKNNGTTSTAFKQLSLSVVPDNSLVSVNVKPQVNDQSSDKIISYPEARGLSITGTLTNNSTGNPLPGTRVNLSIIGQGRDFMAMKTDSEGKFYFLLPEYTGYRDLFLCADNTGTVEPKLLVDNDFCTMPLHIPTESFTLTPQERLAVLNMAVNEKVETLFNVDTIPVVENKEEEVAFYGKPKDIIYIDNYVQLPTLEEYFNGLPTLVKVRKREGEKYFKIIGPQTELTEYEPLIMVDQVAIDDKAKILSIVPTNILRIEIVNELYVKGDQTYGGIINIITRRGDFGGIDLPSSGIFINYSFLADSTVTPKPSTLQHIPDARNTLYWEPKLILGSNNSSEVTFNVSDTPGRYLIILTGVDGTGKVIKQVETLEVGPSVTPF